MTPAQRSQYRAIGGRLALYVRQQPGGLPSVATLQAVAADLAADQTQLVLPLRELVTRPGFSGLVAKVGSGSGALECQALLQTLEATFTPALIAALAEVLSGFLDLPSPASTTAAGASDPLPGAASSTQPRAERPPEKEAWAGTKAPATPSPPTASPAPLSSGAGSLQPRSRIQRLVALALVSTIAAATGGLLSTRPPFCTALRLCGAQQPGATSQQALDAAAAAGLALRRAQDLAAYRQATEQLEQELLKLSGDTLSPEQQQQRQQLQTTATQARAILQEEDADLSRLDTAREAITAARIATGPNREQQLNAARQALEAIPPRSFSASEAERLREQLSALQQEPQLPTPPAPDPGATQSAEPSWSQPPAPSSPAPRPPAPQAPRAPAAAPPTRDQPLF